MIRKPHRIPVLCTACAMMFVAAIPASAADEEPNDSFENREIVSSEITAVQGELTSRFDPAEFDYSFSSTMVPGQATAFDVEDLTPAEPFYAWIDNGEAGPDTVMGVFGPDNTLLAADDDSSPIGNGVASGLGGEVNTDGTIHLAVSGFPDFEFSGLKDGGADVHQESGDYEVRIMLGTNRPEGDVDYYTFTGLEPGSEFAVEVTQGSFDSVLAWLNEEGEILYMDDDGGQELLSKVRGYVPASGNVSVAISAFGDAALSGRHIESGAYTLTLTQP